jgi:hypothetical protein
MGWGLGGILLLSEGAPTWPLDGLSRDMMGQINSEPLAIPSVVSGCTLVNASSGRRGTLQYINSNCLTNAVAPSQAFYNAAAAFGCDRHFAFPKCINLLGDLGRNTVIGPGLINKDGEFLIVFLNVSLSVVVGFASVWSGVIAGRMLA